MYVYKLHTRWKLGRTLGVLKSFSKQVSFTSQPAATNLPQICEPNSSRKKHAKKNNPTMNLPKAH